MKWKCLIVFVLILGAAMLLPIIALNAQEKPILSNELSDEETKIILDETMIFGQILYLYGTKALEKPPDLRLCAYEMFRMKPNDNSCRDKHSSWHSKNEAEIIKSDIEGKFGGVGLEIADKEGKIVVVSPIDGMPAFRAGLKPEDVIFKVDNKPVLNLSDAVMRLRGKPGTPVEITVKRGGREISFELVREIVNVSAVSAKTIENQDGAIGYVKVRVFSEIMPKEFRKEIVDLRSKGITKVILDFRNNPGGLLNSALDILSNFARSGDISIVIRERNESEVIVNLEDGAFHDLRAVILINKGSASASEIFAGAMKDWGFPVVGSRSSGKGVGQTIFLLANGSSLRLTTFEFHVGNSKTKINDIGVIPTYEISDPAPSSAEILPQDRQLEKAIEILSR